MDQVIRAEKVAGRWGGRGSIEQEIDDRAEVYTVRDEVWARARHAVDGRLPVRRSSGEASRPQTEAEALIPGASARLRKRQKQY
jgi:hypothetical protein